ncbi:ABC transporter substrate-binding protein [Hydrogenophaga sp. YM1]|uniref:ABC transporter substrate-binding protein n=1 Tax=Hydrogenophaga TaxID=47420 RepID=UPI00086B7326|nr:MULTISPECIES: ABC transporter substrate-binding protein [unclassified Hydrogenophaga]MBN9373493.1 ABC transporter substrate-binding protein [Hydrogenophaga sp.]ODT34066.1 MAG: ABC transporter substrate-binding protein [Hydrogenophaga sp. SCN 70-13]OJV70180.1 MAG: ABC transporter substrate-binding protein [Hydrogenophaga sp. 70-12]QRR34049.1 ABC transporter substrate-binding protein [Hydrogenophaga sp. YM1]
MPFPFQKALGGALVALGLAAAPAAFAQDTVRVGVIAEMSGPFAEFGKQMQAGIRAYQKMHGDSVAGKRVEVVIKDVGGPNPDAAKRIATELVVREKVNVLAGFGFTPNALAVAPIATQAKVPMIVMNAAAGGLTAKSPYMVRTSFHYPETVPPIAQWAIQQGAKKAYVIVADYSPGHDAEAAFIAAFKKAGGEIVGSVRTPLMTLDFAPYMQRVKDARPDVLFSFVNGGDVAPAFIKEYRDKGLPEAGIQLIGTGDIVDEALVEAIGERGVGITTVYPYSMHHKSALNERFVREFKAQRDAKSRPTIMGVAAYDGMAALYAALAKTGGKADGPTLIAALAGLKIDSPRGSLTIDKNSRDVVHDQYIRRFEKQDGAYYNVEFETFKAAP